MARYTKVLKSLAHNAVGDRRIQAAAPAGNNYYVTGATLGGSPNYTLSLARNGGLSDVTVNLDALAATASPGGSDTQVQYNNGGAFAGNSGFTYNGTNVTMTSNLLLGSNLVHNGDTDTYLGFETNNVRFYAGNTNTMNIKAAGVGIGTNAPGTLLDIHQTADDAAFEIAGYDDKSGVTAKLHVRSNGLSRFLGSTDAQVQSAAGSIYLSSTENMYLDVGTRNTYSHIFRDDTGEFARFKNARLGIGTTAPAQSLDVRGTTLLSGATDTVPFEVFAYGAGTSALHVTSGSNTGLGTATPLGKLHINASAYQMVFQRDTHHHTIVKGNSDDTLTFATGAPGSHTARFKIQPTGIDVVNDAIITGSVGIGITSPTSKLHVKGTLDIQDGNQTILMGAGNSSTSRSNDTLKLARVGLAHYHNAEEPVAMLYAASNGTDNTVVMGGGTSNMNAATKLQFTTAANDATTAGTTRMQIGSDGKVGIGTTAPDSPLDIRGDGTLLTLSGSANAIMKLYSNTADSSINIYAGTDGGVETGYLSFFDGTTGKWTVGKDTGNDFIIYDDTRGAAAIEAKDNSDLLLMQAGGQVGVGMTNPASFSDMLSVQIGSPSGWPIGFTNSAEDVKGAIRTDQGDNYIAFASKSASDIRLFYNDNEANTALIVKGAGGTAGNVGIGTTSPNVKLDVAGDARIRSTNKLYFGDAATTEYIYADGSDLRLHASDNLLLDPADDIVIRADDIAIEANAGGSEWARFNGGETALCIGATTTQNGAYLHVTGSENLLANFISSDGIGEIRVGDSSKYTRLLTAGNQFKIMPFDGVELMVLDGSTEKVGIGTNAPSHKLDVVGTTQLSGAATINGTTTINGGQLKVTDGGASSPLVSIAADDANPWAFHIGNDTYSTAKASGTQMYQGNTGIMNIYHKDIKRMQFQVNGDSSLGTATNVGLYVQSGGNVGIGTNAPGETLHVAGTGRFTGKVAFGGSTLPTNNGISVVDTIQLQEKGSSPTATTAWGTVWVSGSTPNKLYFTDDAGTAHDLTAGGGGTIGGSLSDNYIPIGTAADTIGNFVLGLTEDDSIYLGTNPESTTSSAGNNVGLGIGAFNAITTGDDNTAIGYRALYTHTEGASNVAVGKSAGQNVTTGGQNVLVGVQAGESVGTHSHNTHVGYNAAIYNSGDNNVAIGSNALRTGSNDYNVAVGMSAMTKVSGGAGGVAIGYQSGYHPTGNYNTWVGYNAGFGTAAGGALNNVGIGKEAMLNVSSGQENVVVGDQAGYAILGGSYNVAIGSDAFRAATTANYNVAIGKNAMNAGTLTTNHNVAIGYNAASSAVSALENVAIGSYAAQDLTTGPYNVFVGTYAGTGNTTGQENVAIGHSALQENQEGDHIVAIGRYAAYNTNPTAGTGDSVVVGTQAGFTNTTGVQNTFIGHRAGYSNTTSNQQVFVGREAGYSHTEGTTNIFIGARSGYLNTTGANNTVVGHQALYNNVHGDRNTAIGYQALHSSTPSDGGGQNTAVGDRAGYKTSTGHSNVYMGYLAGYELLAGERNIIIGHEAGRNATSLNYSTLIGNAAGYNVSGASEVVYIGRNSGYHVTGNENTFIGNSAGIGQSAATHATQGSVAIGENAMYYNSTANYNVAVGQNALMGASSDPWMTGDNNVAVGREAMKNASTANLNTAVGYQAMHDATEAAETVAIGGYSAADITTGKWNTVVGYTALRSGTTTNRNTALGYAAMNKYTQAGDGYNVAVGMYAMQNVQTGSSNVAIGYTALAGATGHDMDYNIAIGAQALYSNTTGDENVAVGRNALFANTTGEHNVAIGTLAADSNTTGVDNVVIGQNAMSANNDNYNVVIGADAAQGATTMGASVIIGRQAAGGNVPTGDYNVAIGYQAAQQLHTGAESNTVLGFRAGYSHTTGDDNTFLGANAGSGSTTASQNVAVGKDALKAAQTSSDGGQNSVLGFGAYIDGTGQRNVIAGYRAAYTSTSANSNVALGYEAGYKNTTGDSNVFIGNKAGPSSTSTDSNKLYIHNDEGTPLIGGDFSSGGTLTFTASGNAPNSVVFKHSQVSSSGEDGITIDAREPRISLINRRDTDETWKIQANNSNSSLQIYKDSQLVKAIFSSSDGGGVTFGIGAEAATSGVAIAQGASYSLDNTTVNRIYRTSNDVSYMSNELHYFNNPVKVNGNLATASLGQALEFADRDDLLIRGTASFDMELTSPQDMAFGIDSDNNETAHKFLFKTNSKTPSSAGTTLMEISEAGDVSIAGGLNVTGSTLAVQRTMKNDITSDTTLSDSYSVYQALADGGGPGTVTITAPPSPSIGDTYLIVAGAFGNPGGGGAPTLTGLVRIIANSSQTINGVNTNISIMQSTALQPEYKTAHLVCVDTNTWVMTISAQAPVA